MKRSLACAALCVAAGCSAQDLAAPLPKQLAAVREDADLHTARTMSVIVSSRRMDDPPLPVRAEKLGALLRKGLAKTPFTVIEDSTVAQLNMELVVEPHQRWGTSKSQDAPYLFLLLRDRANARVLYCGYRRIRFFYEWTMNDLVKDFVQISAHGAPAATGDLRACAREAMRLPDVGL